MIVKMGKGAGFKGAAAYILHDKTKEGQEHAQTSERVGFAYAINCGNPNNLKAATARMINTAERAAEIKAAAGESAAGRKLEKPLKTIVLSWEKGEQPTDKQQKTAVSTFLKSMGWQEHQAIIASHNDTDKPHVHILLNRVNPQTGKTLNEKNDYRRADKWALKHMHESGRVRVDEVQRASQSQDPEELKKLAEINPEQAEQFQNQPDKPQTKEQKSKSALAKAQKANWSKHRQQQTKEKKALRATQGKAYKEQAKGWAKEKRAIPREVAADIYAQFAGRFEAVKKLPFEERHAARQSLKTEMAGLRAIEKQGRLMRLQAQRVELMKEQKGQRDSLSKEHKQGSQHLSKSHAAAYQSLDIYYRQTDLQKNQLTMTRARNKALLQATKSGTGIDPNSYYNRLVRRQELRNRAGDNDELLKDFKAVYHQNFTAAYDQMIEESKTYRAEQEQQERALEQSRERSAALVGKERAAGEEVTDRKQESRDYEQSSPTRPEDDPQCQKSRGRKLKR